MARQRLQKVLAAAGIESRRRCEELILEGAVKVNNRVVHTLPAFADPDVDVITVRGRSLRPVRKVYYLLHKPKGVICTNSDPQGRRKAIDLVPAGQRVFCVGRLEIDTSGLVLITNDTELANRMTHPRYGVPKRYAVGVEGRIQDDHIERLKKGIWLSEGKATASAVRVLHRGDKQSMLEITLTRTLNRQIRRMLAGVGLEVESLRRTRIGRLEIRGLGPGQWRMLRSGEIEQLKKGSRASSDAAASKEG
ncbi:MAG: rRNA pseudouridine synthase [Phycisphaerae bacterium]|nr:rRNA pseudouridine synthase [Phycisphaerae bacterium]